MIIKGAVAEGVNTAILGVATIFIRSAIDKDITDLKKCGQCSKQTYCNMELREDCMMDDYKFFNQKQP